MVDFECVVYDLMPLFPCAFRSVMSCSNNLLRDWKKEVFSEAGWQIAMLYNDGSFTSL